MSDSVAFAFAAGMVAAINPCGFALLPAYLTYFLGLDAEAAVGTDGDDPDQRPAATNPAWRALRVSAAMTMGFIAVFGVMGIIWSRVSGVIGDRLPWVTLVLGIGLVVMGIAMIRGYSPVVGIPKLSLSGEGRETWSVFLYGVSYAVASLSCTIGVFVATVTTTFDSQGFLDGVATFVAYGLGMGALVAILTVAVSFARVGIVSAMRRLLPYIGRISGVLMIIAGLFVAYYGWWETQILAGNDVDDGPAGALLDWNGEVSTRIQDAGAGRIGAIIAVRWSCPWSRGAGPLEPPGPDFRPDLIRPAWCDPFRNPGPGRLPRTNRPSALVRATCVGPRRPATGADTAPAVRLVRCRRSSPSWKSCFREPWRRRSSSNRSGPRSRRWASRPRTRCRSSRCAATNSRAGSPPRSNRSGDSPSRWRGWEAFRPWDARVGTPP